MPTRARKPRRPRDTNQLAWQIVREGTGQVPCAPESPDTRNPAAVALAMLGARKGGEARAKKLSSKKRKQIARKAAKARWSKHAT
jgi:hypothetical protein